MNRVKETRKKLKMTQEKLEELSGVAQAEISRIETGKKQHIEVATALRLARALRTTVEYLFPDF